jgi:CTP synthase
MNPPKPKYIFVTGGVLSGLGKGITAASIGNLLKHRGFIVNMQKFDQYINVDAGTLNPAEHGEVFVTDDGGETDLDLGHYERFLNQNLSRDSSVMTGEIYLEVINRERRGDYLGKTVQVIPHLTTEVKDRARRAAESGPYDVHIVEIGGTVGDNEGFHFLEAARQMRLDEGQDNTLYIHVVFLPYLKASGEVKTKPAQNSVRELRSIGIQPDLLIARTDHDIEDQLIQKLSLYTNVETDAILPLVTADTVYKVPSLMEHSHIDEVIMKKLKLPPHSPSNGHWSKLLHIIKAPKPRCSIGLVGKYTTMLDTYASVIEALKAACWQNQHDLNVVFIDAEAIEQNTAQAYLDQVAGVVVPGGFGSRGTEGKIQAIEYARTKQLPYLGLCLGMQLAVIEFARHVAGLPQATSEEFDAQSSQCVIHIMEDQKVVTHKGGTMRLGGWDCRLEPDSLAHQAYGQTQIRERHRHRYEFNNDYRTQLTSAGLRLSGTTLDDKLVEIIEVKDHPWFVGVQFHPEFTSRPIHGHPLFNAFIQAATAKAA